MAEERLQKVLAAAGVDSRRKCEELILTGAVSVNGRVVNKLPAFVDTDKDVIMVGGRKIQAAEKVYFLLNKPKGVICTNFDPQGRIKATDLIKTRQRIFCVGRLDVDTTGLIILSNDNELANRLTHPRYELPKTYVAEVKGSAEAEAVEKLRKGVWLAGGRTAGASVKVIHRGHDRSLLEITISQGLNRQVRRMLIAVSLSVKSLKRTQIGRIDDKGLGVGKFRLLTKGEVAYLKKVTAG